MASSRDGMNPKLLKLAEIVQSEARGAGIDTVLAGSLATALTAETDEEFPPPPESHETQVVVRLRDPAEFESLRRRLLERGLSVLPDRHPCEWGSRRDRTGGGPALSGAAGGAAILERVGAGTESIELLPLPANGDGPVGVREAVACTIDYRIRPDRKIRCATVPGVVLLEIVRFLDPRRGDGRGILYWMENYAIGPFETFRFELLGAALPGVDRAGAGAALLGIKIARMASPRAAACLEDFLQGAGRERFLAEATGRRDPEFVAALHAAFAAGYRAIR